MDGDKMTAEKLSYGGRTPYWFGEERIFRFSRTIPGIGNQIIIWQCGVKYARGEETYFSVDGGMCFETSSEAKRAVNRIIESSQETYGKFKVTVI
jgi:hypothetical protein